MTSADSLYPAMSLAAEFANIADLRAMASRFGEQVLLDVLDSIANPSPGEPDDQV